MKKEETEKIEMEIEVEKKQIYSVGIYARLSVEHGIKADSITSQIAIAKEYLAQQEEMCLYNCYSDLGESGTHFKRNGFLKLMEDIRAKKVNCVLVKDFSRFGRNYIEVENYIDKIFPFLGVRFISIADGFDSLHKEENELDRNLKNLINEIYANDTAQKVKEIKQFYREQGNYLGSKAPYGYRIERKGGKRVLVRDAAFKVTETIAQLFLEGKNQREIAVWLYQNRVHRPSDYRKTGHIYCIEGETLFEWKRGSIRQVLHNFFSVQQIETAILKKEQDSFILEQYAQRKQEEKQKKKPDFSVWRGKCYCGDCHQKLTFRSDLKKKIFYCAQANRIDRLQCKKKQITEENLSSCIRIVLEKMLLKNIYLVLNDTEREELEIYTKKKADRQIKKQKAAVKQIERQIAAGKRMISESYIAYQMKKMEREEFFIKKEAKKKKLRRLEEEKQKSIQQIQRIEKQLEEIIKWIERTADGQIEERFIVLYLIKRAEVFCGNRILVQFYIRR